jgi:hypothetical protein
MVNLLHYRRIGHMFAAIVLGLLGALLGTLFSARSKVAKGETPHQGTASQRVGVTDHPTDMVG